MEDCESFIFTKRSTKRIKTDVPSHDEMKL